jgi:hypothetical protein
MMRHFRRATFTGAASVLMVATLAAAGSAQKGDKGSKEQENAEPKRPKITLKAQPLISMAPARVVLTAELVGGDDDFEDFYCPAVEWEWGDGTKSESSTDCAPYEPGKSEIKRRFTVEHVFRTGRPNGYRVTVHLKRRDRSVGVATVAIQVRPGLRDGFPE